MKFLNGFKKINKIINNNNCLGEDVPDEIANETEWRDIFYENSMTGDTISRYRGYKGLWILGLDILPLGEKIEFAVANRVSEEVVIQCSMEIGKIIPFNASCRIEALVTNIHI